MSVEFESPATRVIKQFSGKDEQQFRIPVDLPDLSFLRALSIQGRLRYTFGTDNSGAAADLVTITPATGETLFLYRIHYQVSSANGQTFTYNNAGQLREQLSLSTTIGSFVVSDGWVDSLVGNGVDSIVIRATSANGGTRSVNVFTWTENTSRIRDVAI